MIRFEVIQSSEGGYVSMVPEPHFSFFFYFLGALVPRVTRAKLHQLSTQYNRSRFCNNRISGLFTYDVILVD